MAILDFIVSLQKKCDMNLVKQLVFEDFIFRVRSFGQMNYSLYQDKIVIVEWDRQSAPEEEINHPPLFKIDAFCIIMVESGEGVVNIDYRPFRVGKNTVIVFSDRHIVQYALTSYNFKVYNMFVASDFARSILKDTQMAIPDVSAVSFISNPVFQLEQKEFMRLRDNLERLRDNINRNDHAFWNELVQNEMENLSFELRNMMLQKLANKPQKQKYTRSEQVISRFVQLLFAHGRTEREVSFYAEKLGVTPVYLSRAVKRAIGKPAIKLIQEMAISDAMSLLRKPNMTIQEASDAMNFPDRDTFSRYFKNMAGETPGEYRKKAKLNQ